MIPRGKKVSYEEFLWMDMKSDDNLEFIDGEIYLLAAPSVIHQLAVTNLSAEFRNYFKNKDCIHFVAPFDVVLKDEEKIHKVQPDLTVICDKKGLGEQNYTGVPTLIVEVLSPSTASNDFIKKMGLYMRVGVQEYWIISPKNNTVHVFPLKEDGFYSEPNIYSKDDIVKSSIFKDLEITLSDIFS
jgi:Uma2 family endonuclease